MPNIDDLMKSYKGIRVLPFCVICRRGAALRMDDGERFIDDVVESGKFAFVAYFFPTTKEAREATGNRVVMYLVCDQCAEYYPKNVIPEVAEACMLSLCKAIEPVKVTNDKEETFRRLLERKAPFFFESEGEITLFLPRFYMYLYDPDYIFSGKFSYGKKPKKVVFFWREGKDYKFTAYKSPS